MLSRLIFIMHGEFVVILENNLQKCLQGRKNEAVCYELFLLIIYDETHFGNHYKQKVEYDCLGQALWASQCALEMKNEKEALLNEIEDIAFIWATTSLYGLTFDGHHEERKKNAENPRLLRNLV